MTYRKVAERLNVTNAGARNIIDRLAGAGILEPLADSYPKLFAAQELLDLLE